MVITCSILFLDTNDSVYKAGQTVKGTVKYVIDKPTKFKSATLSLIGNGICRWTRRVSGIGAMYIGSEDYVVKRMNLLQDRENQIVTLQAGTYDQSFHFELPKEIPSSYNDFTCTISYRITLKFVKLGYFINLPENFYAKFRVQGIIKPCLPAPLIKELRKEFNSPRKCLTLKAEIKKTFLTAGDNINLSLFINNDSHVPITNIKTVLIESITYMSGCGRENNKLNTLKGTERNYPGVIENSVEKVLYNVPTLPGMFSINSNILVKEYKLKITAKFPFPHKKAYLELPVAITEKLDNVEVVNVLDDKPPSYWQVMSEDKDNTMKKEIEKKKNDDAKKEADDVQPHSSKT